MTPAQLIQQTSSEPARASVEGGALSYYSTHPAIGADSSSYFYLSTRGTSGWSLDSVGPQGTAPALFEDECEQNIFFSPNLARNIDEEGWAEATQPARCKNNEQILVPGEPFQYRNLFLHDNLTNSYQLVNVTPPDVPPANATFQDASDDFSQIVFSEEAKLTPDAPAGNNFYVWADGVVRLLTRSPGGSVVPGELAEAAGYRSNAGVTSFGNGFAPVVGALSADGRRAFFYFGGGLYLRQNPDQPQSTVSAGQCTEPARACTVQIDVSHGPGASGGGVFWRASSDGSKVFFTADRKLTVDSTAVAGKADLYEYDVDLETLVDLTVNGSGPADVRGVNGIGDDGSYLYFVANEVLAPGAIPGNCNAATATGQTCNLYLAHEGSIRFVASLSRQDRFVWQESFNTNPAPLKRPASLSADTSSSGRFLVFSSLDALTGYDNHDLHTGQLDRQIFLYDANANGGLGALECVSCNEGSQPVDSTLRVVFGGENGASPGGNASWGTNTVLDDGRVFFDSADPLVATDTNGLRDVYEYRDGDHHLISSGTYGGRAHFLDASPSGDDVFFRTPESLVRTDIDRDHASIYDARVGGGIEEPPPAEPACYGSSCEGTRSVNASPVISSFRGEGNVKRGKRKRCKAAKRGKRCRTIKRGKRCKAAKRGKRCRTVDRRRR